MVALTLCEAARSPFDIICGARAGVCVRRVCAPGVGNMQAETSRRRRLTCRTERSSQALLISAIASNSL